MSFDLFEKENAVIRDAEALLEKEGAVTPPLVRDRFYELLKEYKKLSKASKRLVKVADRNEHNLQKANEEISAQKDMLERTQSELVQAEKLASLGQLVAGVAHELNTPLGIILTSASSLNAETNRLAGLMGEAKAKKSDVTQYLGTATRVCELLTTHSQNASDLITSFKAISVDRNVDEVREFELNSYIQDTLRSLKPALKNNQVEISCIETAPITMNSYPGALNQIVTNLVMNAYKHGLSNGEMAGKITITLASDTPNTEIKVADNGKGIAADFISKIFDPFVTTTRNDGGTGLGLNITHNLVTGKLKGTIKVESNTSGGGTCFLLSLPTDVGAKKLSY